MSVGTPVVASNVGETPHMIDDGTDGFLISPKADPETLAWLLLSIKNDAKYKSVGMLARQKIMDKFQEDTMVRNYKNVIESVMHG